ncbi:hypothetical protein MA16_Dca005893 [Dendrobium catenatum]|uniref:Uncharacterized protein n=1 Tax=Dendrobium catenatum TaxID=906689 RepID=A0A2I0WXG9_9ASPA|nr:hypothetical protein MA16_Dca005893 [Dendrobium catenatum]
MADLAVDHGLFYDINGDIHVLRSPFFDVGFGFDNTVEEYLDRILPTLVDAIDDQFPTTRGSLKVISPSHLRVHSPRRHSSAPPSSWQPHS